jgi:hypothetical protein
MVEPVRLRCREAVEIVDPDRRVDDDHESMDRLTGAAAAPAFAQIAPPPDLRAQSANPSLSVRAHQ